MLLVKPKTGAELDQVSRVQDMITETFRKIEKLYEQTEESGDEPKQNGGRS